MVVEDFIALILFVIPGWISVYVIYLLVGFQYPRNNFERLIQYVFHNSAAIFLFWTFYKLGLNRQLNYGLDNAIWIVPFAIIWGLFFSSLVWVVNRYKLLPNGLLINTNLFREIHWRWFRDGYCRITLKNGLILKGWLYATEMDNDTKKHYIALANYSILQKTGTKKIKYIEVYKPKDYQMVFVEFEKILLVEYFHARMKRIKNIEKDR